MTQLAPVQDASVTSDPFMALIDGTRRINLAEVEVDDRGLPLGFRMTATFSTVIERVEYARKINAPLALVTGAHGAGKTTALRYYAQQEGVLYWVCKPKYLAKHVLADIAMSLGISTGVGWSMQTSIVVSQLRERPLVFLLDEAQRLDYDACDLLKYLADESGSTFVLAASPSLEKRIEKWPDIDSRCPVRARVSSMGLEEFSAVFGPDGYRADTLAEIHKVTKGIYRNMHYFTRHLEERMQGTSLTLASLTPKHVRKLAEKVFV